MKEDMFKKSNSDFISNVFCTQQEQSLCWWRWKLFSYSFTHTHTNTLYLSPKFLKSWHKKKLDSTTSSCKRGRILYQGRRSLKGRCWQNIVRRESTLRRRFVCEHFPDWCRFISTCNHFPLHIKLFCLQ